MSNPLLINAFNKSLGDFMTDLIKAFPDESFLKTFNVTFSFMRKVNPKQIVVSYMNYIGPYSKQIFECDTDFFLDFEENIGVDHNYLSNGLRLKHLWLHENTTDHTKACIISYMQNLLKIGSKISL
jgi:hypothetical protein